MLPLLAACVAAGVAACVPAAGPAPATPAADALPPPGYGTLRQDEITLTLESGELQVKITPLAEWVLRLTAPDTYRRLSALAAAHSRALAADVAEPPSLFLVSFFSRSPGTIYRPEDLEMVNRGRRMHPAAIRALTEGFDTRRLDAEVAQMALYAFPAELDLGQDLVAEYGAARSAQWSVILRRLETERSRVRARVGWGNVLARLKMRPHIARSPVWGRLRDRFRRHSLPPVPIPLLSRAPTAAPARHPLPSASTPGARGEAYASSP